MLCLAEAGLPSLGRVDGSAVQSWLGLQCYESGRGETSGGGLWDVGVQHLSTEHRVIFQPCHSWRFVRQGNTSAAQDYCFATLQPYRSRCNDALAVGLS